MTDPIMPGDEHTTKSKDNCPKCDFDNTWLGSYDDDGYSFLCRDCGHKVWIWCGINADYYYSEERRV